MSESYQAIITKASEWSEAIVRMIPNFLLAVIVLFLCWLIARAVRRGVRSVSERFTDSPAMQRLLGTFAYIAVLIAGLVVALEVLNLGTAVTSLLAGAGIVGLAIGFAFQDLIANFIAGSMLAVRRPFRVGDLVETNGYTGTVLETNLRATEIKALQGEYVIIPNKDVFQNPLVNYNTAPTRRVDIKCGVSYSDDLELVRDTALAVLHNFKCRHSDREPDFYFTEFGDSSINFTARFWVDFKIQPDYLQAQSDAIMALKQAFDEKGIDIPFPVRTVLMHNT